jgi:protein O-GlcNAc transferase
MHPENLADFNEKLAGNRLTKPLFDTPLFTRHLEDAFKQMHERSIEGLEPADLFVNSGAKPN